MMRYFEYAGRRIEHNKFHAYEIHLPNSVTSRNSPENLQSFVPVPQDRTINARFIRSKFASLYVPTLGSQVQA